MIRNLNTFAHFKSTPFKLISNRYRFASNSIQTTTYPYVLGGLKDISFIQNQNTLAELKQMFDQNILKEFKEAYKSILYSLAQKDKKSLQNICEPTLLKNLTFKDVELVNPDAEIQVICGKSFKAFGINFIRQSTTKVKEIISNEDSNFYLSFGLSKTSNSSSMMKYMSEELPILIGYEALFKSSMKLVPESDRKHQITEIHSLQLQAEIKINAMEYIKMMMSIKQGEFNISHNEASRILKQMIGNNFNWKVGDIDRVLKGNLEVIG